MSTHNICIHRKIRKILCGYPLLSVAMPQSGTSNSYQQMPYTYMEKWRKLCQRYHQILILRQKFYKAYQAGSSKTKKMSAFFRNYLNLYHAE